jgi:uncharacterized damage-inducible protein DinB
MDLQYPIGKADLESEITPARRLRFIDDIEQTPVRLRNAIAGLSEEQLDTPYRPQGWTVRQVVHHLADSHLNSYVRFKLALTEDNPTIKPYDESRWAELVDAKFGPVGASVMLIDTLHQRWAMMLKNLAPEDFGRTFQHPERGRMSLDRNLALYAWHGAHHVAHITELRKRNGW